MQIKIIATGSTKWEHFIRRWGVSFLIGEDVLFDAFGHAGVFWRNIRKYNVDTMQIKHVVVSHKDWDHIAGLWHLIEGRNDMTVYICPGFSQEFKDKINSSRAKVVELSGLSLIKEGVYSTGQIYVESEGRQIYEQSLILEMKDNLAVITGCAHPGILNIIDFVKHNLNKEIFLVIGGFHLKDSSWKEIVNIVAELKASGIKKIAPTHCTGKKATSLMQKEFQDRFIKIAPASIIEI